MNPGELDSSDSQQMQQQHVPSNASQAASQLIHYNYPTSDSTDEQDNKIFFLSNDLQESADKSQHPHRTKLSIDAYSEDIESMKNDSNNNNNMNHFNLQQAHSEHQYASRIAMYMKRREQYISSTVQRIPILATDEKNQALEMARNNSSGNENVTAFTETATHTQGQLLEMRNSPTTMDTKKQKLAQNHRNKLSQPASPANGKEAEDQSIELMSSPIGSHHFHQTERANQQDLFLDFSKQSQQQSEYFLSAGALMMSAGQIIEQQPSREQSQEQQSYTAQQAAQFKLCLSKNVSLQDRILSKQKALELIGAGDSTALEDLQGMTSRNICLRIPVKEYEEKCQGSQTMYQTNSNQTLMHKSSFFMKKNTSLTPMTKRGLSIENTMACDVSQTKKIVRQAKKQKAGAMLKAKTQLVQFAVILQRVLRLVQIKRLFQRNYQLSELQYDLISDASYVSQANSMVEERMSNMLLRKFNWLAMQLLNRPLKFVLKLLPKISARSVIKPESKVNLVWMLSQLIIYSLFLTAVSVTLFFGDEVFSKKSTTTDEQDRWLNIFFVFGITILDFFKELNCGYYHCGEVVVDRSKILQRYLKSPRIYFDSLAFLSLLADVIQVDFASVYVIQFFKMLVFFKLYTIYEVIVRIQSHFLFSVSWNNWISLVKLIFTAVFTCHCMAILYYQQALLQIRYLGATNTWVDMANLLADSNSSSRYVHSFYNATTLMVAAIQYNPVEPMESLFVTFATIGNTAFFGFIVTALGSIVENFHRRSQDHRRELAILNQFMDTTNIPKELQIRVRNYLEYHHNQQETMDHSEFNEILTKLPLKIKNEVQIVVNSSHREQLLDQFYQEIPLQNPRDQIYSWRYHHLSTPFTSNSIHFTILPQDSTLDDSSLYLILEGKVDIYLRNRSGKEKRNGEDYVITELTKGASFGEYSFFTGGERQAGAKASSYCTLAKVKREDFLQSLEYFHEDFEKFKLIQDEILLYNNYKIVQLTCAICSSSKHLARDCQTVLIHPYRSTIINVYNRPLIQERNSDVLRLQPTKFSPMKNVHPLIQSAINIVENYPDEIDAIELARKKHNQELKENSKHTSAPATFTAAITNSPGQGTPSRRGAASGGGGGTYIPINGNSPSAKLAQQQQQQPQQQPYPRKSMVFFRQLSAQAQQARGVQFRLSGQSRPSNSSGQEAASIAKQLPQHVASSKQDLADNASDTSSDSSSGSDLYSLAKLPEKRGSNPNNSRLSHVINRHQFNIPRSSLDEIGSALKARKSHSEGLAQVPQQQQQQQQQQSKDQVLLLECLKSYTFYYPDENFVNVMKRLITKKVIHSSRIGKLVNKVNQVSQQRQKNLIKIKLYQSELKKKEQRSVESKSLLKRLTLKG